MMPRTQRKKLYKKAFSKWGMELQLNQLMEECAELIVATNKVIRKYKTDSNVWRNFVEEIADVEIMLEQVKTQITWANLEKRIEIDKHDKLLRLEERLI